VALGLGASAVDDPDQQFYQNYACGSELKGLTTMVNSIYNGWRMEDVWLDR
jgi:hypothetical protein